MQNTDELIELRAQRLELLHRLNRCDSMKRQLINKRLIVVNKRIQRLSGTHTVHVAHDTDF